ncbi:MAG: phosphoribosyltransferase [Candidatus Blackburnbacteria bacterium]|nr:phosphoribosyltransferase [Candidatus Blackburnbacteria bacterium]
MRFKNRSTAGRLLARKLGKYKNKNTIVLALPRGGVPVGFEIAKVLHVPFSVIVARKIGMPGNPEFGIGAISEGDVVVLDIHTIKQLDVSKEAIEKAIEKERKELARRVQLYRKGKPLPKLSGHTAILVDDGLATGVTARAAIKAIRKMNPRCIVAAFPVCAADTAGNLKQQVNNLVSLLTSVEFTSVGSWYEDFQQVTDKKVVELLKKFRKVSTLP